MRQFRSPQSKMVLHPSALSNNSQERRTFRWRSVPRVLSRSGHEPVVQPAACIRAGQSPFASGTEFLWTGMTGSMPFLSRNGNMSPSYESPSVWSRSYPFLSRNGNMSRESYAPSASTSEMLLPHAEAAPETSFLSCPQSGDLPSVILAATTMPVSALTATWIFRKPL